MTMDYPPTRIMTSGVGYYATNPSEVGHDQVDYWTPAVSKQFQRSLMSTLSEPDDPLFVNKAGNRINTRNIYRLCQRVLQQVLAKLPEEEKFAFTPHKLRHTFLKRVTDKHGVHFAQELSGNVSIKEIFRYAKPVRRRCKKPLRNYFTRELKNE